VEGAKIYTMKRIKIKKIVFGISTFGVLLLLSSTILRKILFSVDGYCYLKYSQGCNILNDMTVWNIYNLDNFLIYVFPILLFFSLLTYRMRDEIFEYWMRFAVWAGPAVIIAHILVYIIFYRNGSPDVFEKIVVVPIFVLIYGLFVLISLWRIIAKLSQLKKDRQV